MAFHDRTPDRGLPSTGFEFDGTDILLLLAAAIVVVLLMTYYPGTDERMGSGDGRVGVTSPPFKAPPPPSQSSLPAEPTPKPTTEPIPKPATEPLPDPTTEPTPNPITEPRPTQAPIR